MELPSMVQKSGGTLIVRSVVSGIPIYTDESMEDDRKNNKTPIRVRVGENPNSFIFGEHLEELKRAQEHLMQQQQQSLVQEHQRLQAAAMELKEEGLPQCKIKRNYSCNYCTYFTQNPRYHLTHLRDVHGEKIVINKCKLCLYASRHYQKLVRHMKMVHGCTDGIASGHGQARGKRGMNRDARKRKLEEGGPSTGVISALSVEAINAEHAKSDMEREQQKLQRDIEAFKKQQEDHQKSQQQKFNEAIFAAAAFEQQLRVQREFDNRESLKSAAHSNYEQKSPPVQNHEGSPSQNKTFDNATPAHSHHSTPVHLPPQRSSLELTPSPSGSNSSPSPSLPLPSSHGQQQMQHMDAISGGSDEPSNNRLMKCSLCDFATLYRNLLLEHEIEDHCNAKFYRCEKCSYVTHIKARFSKHVKYHSMPMIKCVTCDFRTPYKWNLDRHMKNHGGAGPFKCAACDFTADIKQSLTVHEMNHHVPPVGHAAGMTLARRRNKVGGTDLNEDFFSDSAEMLEDHFNNNNMDEYDEMLMTAGPVGVYESKRLRYDDDEPTDLSQKGGSSDTSSVHNSNLSIPKAKKPLPNLIPITKESGNILNLSTDLASRSSLSDIASMFFNEKQISEMMQPTDKTDVTTVAAAAQLSPTTTVTSSASSRSILNRKSGSFFEKIKSSSATNENLICPCGHMAKCLSESIIHRKTCTFSPLSINDDIDLDDDEHDEDAEEGRLEIDFTEDDECDKQSHSALNLSVSGSTRCQHCRHRCKSSADLLNHLKICSEANSRCDSLSGDSCAGSRAMMGDTGANEVKHPMENRVFIWNKLPRNQQESGVGSGSQSSEGNRQLPGSGNSSSNAGGSLLNGNNDENSYYGVETAPGYGEVTKKMTPEEEAANSSLKKVYKCPHCSFWASTASRFHVHIVGHLNKKPFECSLCSYRSNWRWDITKHIRLKTIRDPSHKNARVLMNDETGRRNYTKYNKYITLMKVTEEDGDPKLMKSGEMTPNQVASLAFINDFNSKQQVSSPCTSNTNVNNLLNGVREDITLEPIPPKQSVANVDDQLSDNFIRLPLLASMMNAAIAQQQQHNQNDIEQNGPATLITPSVTISAVKKSPPSNQTFKPSDEITLEIRQEGNEKITNYKCRKCNFRHVNRDAVLAHVKVHFPDTNQGFNSAKMGQQQATSNNNGTMQVPVNSNLYMNKVLAAMCLSQQQQQHNSNANTPLSNLMAAGLLDQANSSQLSGLALALAGKSPVKATHLNAAANIIEHGEQKASLNEASAQNTMTSPNQLTLNSPQNQQQTHAASSSSVTGVGSTNSPSLQHLLTSPRVSFSQTPLNINQNEVLNNNNNDSKVMGSPLVKNKSGLVAEMSPSSPSATPNTIVTTTTTPLSTPNHHAYQVKQSPFSLSAGEGGLLTGDIIGGIQDHHSMVMGATLSASSDHLPTSTVVNNNNNNNNNNNMATSLSAASSCSASLLSLSNQNYIQNQNRNQNQTHSSSSNNKNNLGNLSGNGVSNNNNSNNNNGIGNGNGNNNNNNLLTHDTTTADRRDPSPYRCGHCHQVSNWKHVIQRHCRLKHAGVINIEALDRTALGDRLAPPIYKPLVNGATNETNSNNNNNSNSNNANSHFNLTLKALQQQHQQQNQNNSHNNVLINSNNHLKTINNAIKSEPTNNLLHSPITNAPALNTGSNASQDLQAAAVAYLAAAAAAVANQNNNLKAINSMTEELILQQQLQQNDQIEITRVSSTNHPNNNNSNINNNNSNHSNNNILSSQPSSNNSNLAQLLESNLNTQLSRVSSPQNNAKSKQQKCPLCTYICDSKSQMNYHISLHKPTQYECRLCTFVCAKKQHLSSHMRTVHQVLATGNSTNASSSANNINMDFNLALQMASAVQNQDASNFSTPLAIDLSSSPVARTTSNLSHNQQTHQNQLPPEYQYRMIYYCNKCPARYAQKHNDPLTAQKDLDEHIRQHEGHNSSNDDGKRKYHCDYCDYRAPHESIIQTHRYVHTTQYQEKCNELYKNCKEDSVHRAPKLMHITATKKPHMHETIWVVDHELNEGHQQSHSQTKHNQNSIITSSSQNNSFETGNSLLKKQLESRQVAATSSTHEEVHSKSTHGEVEDSNTASTLASVATGDLGNDNETHAATTPEAAQQGKSASTNNDNREKCEHCPFESSNAEEYKTHLHQHTCVSQQKLSYTCEHCDYSADEQEHIEEHTRVHFNGIEKLKDVSFFTRYDKLELSMEQQHNDEDENVADVNSNNLNIKKELQSYNNNNNNNNNNEENRVNENLKDSAAEALKVPEQKQPKCAKIILYKNDGCLTIKKESTDTPASQTQQQQQQQQHQHQQQTNTITENISDRLRRRISRQGTAGSNSLTSNQLCATNSEEQPLTSTSTSSTSHKTILVNAKTGQVISRN